jgi:DNA-binding MarR family transcriptional regulator
VSERHGLTRQQSRLLFVLHAAPSNMLGLGAELRLGKSTMTGVVARMEAAGLVQRAPDPRDRRNALLSPTPRGAAIALAFEHEMRDRILELLAPLDTEQRGTLGMLLSRVMARAEELLPPE